MSPSLQYLALPATEKTEAHRLAYWLWQGNSAVQNTAICVHGLTRNGRDFDFLAQGLLPDYQQILCPDIIGRGASDRLTNTQSYHYETYITDLLMLLGSQGIASIDWIGTSLGGIVGMLVAAHYPQVIRKLVLNDIGAVIPLAGLQRINQYVGTGMTLADRAAAEAIIRSLYTPFGIEEEHHWQHFITHSFTQQADGSHHFAYDAGILDAFRAPDKTLLATEDTLLWSVWDAIQCPVLILRGETSDILTAETMAEMLTRNPHATAVTIANTGHAPALMDGKQIQMIKEWLEG
jgi:pimeloyl-ACP methyl ester carboxylesterase